MTVDYIAYLKPIWPSGDPRRRYIPRMSSADEASRYIQFEFEGDAVVAVRIESGWSEAIDPEHFGTAAVIAFHEQSAQRQFRNADTARAGRLEIPASEQQALGERMVEFNRRAFAVLQDVISNLASGDVPEQPAPIEFVGGGGCVKVLATQGAVTDIEVDAGWLKADSTRIEDGLVEALNKVQPSDDWGLGALRAEHAELSRILNDYRRQ